MDKCHFRILCYIYKHPYVSFSKIQSKFKDSFHLENMISSLENENMISFRIAESEKLDEGYEHLRLKSTTYLLCTPKGNEYVENRFSNNTRWNITTAIALFATIGAYRSELAFLLRAVEKLLKLLMENLGVSS